QALVRLQTRIDPSIGRTLPSVGLGDPRSGAQYLPLALTGRLGLPRMRNSTCMRTSTFMISLFALATVTGTVMPAHAAPSNVGPVADTRFGVAEGFRNPAVMTDIGFGWERLVLPWDQIQ